MYHFYVQGERDGKGPCTSACHYESMTEQTDTFRSTNKYHGKLTDVNLVFHQCCNNGHTEKFTSHFVYLCCSA